MSYACIDLKSLNFGSSARVSELKDFIKKCFDYYIKYPNELLINIFFDKDNYFIAWVSVDYCLGFRALERSDFSSDNMFSFDFITIKFIDFYNFLLLL